MPRRYAPKKSNQSFVIKVTFFLLLSLPLIVLGLVKNSFDTRNRAFDELELSEQNPCIISVPNVNPYSLEVGETIRVTVDARLSNAGIESLLITDSSGTNIFTESYDTAPTDIGTSFQFTPSKSGMIDMLGVVRKVGGGSVGCKISSPYDIKGLRAVQNNSSPEFQSDPSQSKPSQDIKTGTQYEYVLTANDVDTDRINYSYSFTPKADWLTKSVVEDGSNGKLTLIFKGSTTKPASYLANVVIHDGYSKHVRSQSWVISVSPATNDIPIVKIIQPSESLRLDLGTSFRTSWQAADLNHIIKYQLFMAPNPTDESTWLTVENAIPYNMNSYNVNTSNIPAGTYNLIVRATDNQKPANTGMAISPEIVLSRGGGTQDSETDDQIFLGEPQVTNMSPSNTDKITNKRVTVKATIIASIKSEINESSILFKIDDKDVTKSVKINKVSNSEYTLLYQPEENFKAGEHKAEISFQDSASKSATKSWTFAISSQDDEDTGTVSVFGLQISKRTLIIIVVGILIIAAAILAPFLISSIWKENSKVKEESVYVSNRHLPSSLPFGNGMYGTNIEVNEEVKSMVEKEPEIVITKEEEKKDVWDNYVAPKPEPEEERKEQDIKIEIEEPTKIEIKQEEETPVKEEVEIALPVLQEPEKEIQIPKVEVNINEEKKVEPPVSIQINHEQKTEFPTPKEETKQEEEITLLQEEPKVEEIKYEAPVPTPQEPPISITVHEEPEKQPEEITTTPIEQEEALRKYEISIPEEEKKEIEPEITATSSEEKTLEITPQQSITPPLEPTVIPEPEAPEASDLQKIFEQIQKTEE